jgi:hypothetical protein
MTTLRPSLRRAVEFIAMNDDPTYQGGVDGKCEPRDLEGQITVIAASEALGCKPARIVRDVLRLRLREGLVHPDDEPAVKAYIAPNKGA